MAPRPVTRLWLGVTLALVAGVPLPVVETFDTYALVAQLSEGSPDGNDFTTGAIDTTGANFAVVCVSQYEAESAVEISDSKSNTWTELTVRSVTGDTEVRTFYTQGGTFGTSHTFTAANVGIGNAYASVTVAAFSGAQVTPFDQESGTTGTGTSASPGSLTPSQNDSLVINCLGFGASNTPSVTGLTEFNETNYSSGTHYGISSGYVIQTTASAINPSWSWSTSNAYAVSQAVFKATGGGGGGPAFPIGVLMNNPIICCRAAR